MFQSDVPADDAEGPLYQRLYALIVARIREGLYPPGSRLPPTRRLAAELGVHRNTLVRTFSLLEQRGWIDAAVGRGSFVRARPIEVEDPQGGSDVAPPPAPEGQGVRWQGLLSRAVLSEPLDRSRRLSASRFAVPSGGRSGMGDVADMVDLAHMQPSADLIPHEDFAACLGGVLDRLGPRALGYAPSQGDPELRALLAEDLGRSGVRCAPEDIVVTTGSQQGLDLLARALIDPGDRFITESRTYSGALTILGASGAEVIGVGSDDAGPRIAELEAARGVSETLGRPLKGIYLVPNARNPLGSSIAEGRRAELLGWSARSGVPIIEDDYAADLVLEPRAVVRPLRAEDPSVLYVGTFSKKLMPALRVGFLVIPAGLRGPLLALKHAMDLGTSPVLQLALAEFLRRGLLAPHLARVQAAYRRRRDAFVEALRLYLPDEAPFTTPEQGVALWLTLPRGVDATAVQAAAARAGVLVSPGGVYAARASLGAGLRLTFCAEPEDRLIEGARRLGGVLRRALSPSARAGVGLMGV